MAGLPLLTDNHVRDSIIQALRRAGWDVVRAVDLFGERNDDEELLAWAGHERTRLGDLRQKASTGSLAAGWIKGGPSGWSSGHSNATAR